MVSCQVLIAISTAFYGVQYFLKRPRSIWLTNLKYVRFLLNFSYIYLTRFYYNNYTKFHTIQHQIIIRYIICCTFFHQICVLEVLSLITTRIKQITLYLKFPCICINAIFITGFPIVIGCVVMSMCLKCDIHVK